LLLGKSFGAFCLSGIEVLFLLVLLEDILLFHICRETEYAGRGKIDGVYKVFSVVAVQVLMVVVAAGLSSKKRKPHEAKLLVTWVLFVGGDCNRGLLQEKGRAVCVNVVLEKEILVARSARVNCFAGSHNWDHIFLVKFEDMISESCWVSAYC
jgi:hypothetical protein